jgi:membrane protease YdiL (CAAX protease family)
MVAIIKDRRFCLLWLGSILGSVAILPYETVLAGIELSKPLLFGAFIQAILTYAVIVFLGIRSAEKVDFQIGSSKKCIMPSVISGLVVGWVIKLSDYFIFKNHAHVFLNSLPDINLSYRIPAIFYGAINEEVLFRLFSISLAALLLQKLTKLSQKVAVILSIVLCALLFAIGHLPMLYQVTSAPNVYDITRIMGLLVLYSDFCTGDMD